MGGPGAENKDFELGLDLTRLAEQSENSVEQVLKDLHLGKAKVEVSFSPRQRGRKKRKKKEKKSKVEIKGALKEVELLFWNSRGKKIASKKLLPKEKTLTQPLKINYPL